MSAYQELLLQIEAFTKRFYSNRILKGLLLFVGIFLLGLLVFSSLEYIGRFGIFFRGFLFFAFLLLNGFLFWFYILDPLLKLNKIGKRLSPIDASKMIAQLIPSISDKVLNTLQLEQSASIGNLELIHAAIEQKSSALNTVSFVSAINLRDNKKYAKFILPVLFVFGLILFINPNIIGNGTKRLINYNRVFVDPAPFQFVWVNPQKELEEGSEFDLKLELKGTNFPEKVLVNSNYGKFLLSKTGKNTFEYHFPRLSKELSFHFEGGGFNSNEHEIAVFGSSQLGEIKVKLHYPKYTGKLDEEISNPVLMTVPEGTKVQFYGNSKNGSQTKWIFSDTQFVFHESAYDFSYDVFHAQKLKAKIQNEYTKFWSSEDKIIEVIKDAYPTISAKETTDSLQEMLRYFNGFADDDYGVNGVYFVAQITQNGKLLPETKDKVSGVQKEGGNFYYYLDFAKMNLAAGDVLNYYFVVYDNDGVHGSKSASTTHFTYKVPSKEELKENRENSLSSATSGVSELQKEMLSFQRKMDELRKSNLNNSEIWKKKEMLNDLMNQQKDLQEKLQEMNKNLEKTLQEQSLFDKVNPELLEKQDLLKKMLDEVMDDELKKLLDELSKMMEQGDKNKIEEKMKDMKLSNDEMNRKMDRTLEMLKKMAVEEKLDNAIDQLKELAKKQDDLKQNEEKGLESKEAKAQQDSLNKQFDAVKKDLEELQKKNEELAQPMKLDTEKELQNSIKEEMKQASEKLDDNKSKKAGDNQQKAGEEMEQLESSLSQQKEESEQQQEGEDMETIRAILENLMTLSFDQEATAKKLKTLSQGDPEVNQLARTQKTAMDDYQEVKDSLVELAKRVPPVSKFIDEKLKIIDGNYASIMSAWTDKKFNDVEVKLQLVMTAYNDLALMLNESLEQMQQQMRKKEGGKGSCSKPGGKSPKPNPGMSMQSMKDMLKKQLDQMKKGKDGKGGEGQKPGNDGQPMPGGMGNKEIAKMAAEQQAIRQALNKLKQELNKDGKGTGNQLNPLLDELEKQEKELVNKQDKTWVKRQQEILTRLLESEKALEERELDKKRESKSGENQENSNLIQFLEYKKKKEAEIEQLRSKTPSLNQYYRQRADMYFNNVQKND